MEFTDYKNKKGGGIKSFKKNVSLYILKNIFRYFFIFL